MHYNEVPLEAMIEYSFGIDTYYYHLTNAVIRELIAIIIKKVKSFFLPLLKRKKHILCPVKKLKSLWRGCNRQIQHFNIIICQKMMRTKHYHKSLAFGYGFVVRKCFKNLRDEQHVKTQYRSR